LAANVGEQALVAPSSAWQSEPLTQGVTQPVAQGPANGLAFLAQQAQQRGRYTAIAHCLRQSP
jgi:hypothetical protein